jgi:CheY-like chemotaxis protein
MRSRPELDQIPVVFITAKVQPTEVTHYKSLGALDVLAKPFDPMKLAAQVRSIWSNRDV